MLVSHNGPDSNEIPRVFGYVWLAPFVSFPNRDGAARPSPDVARLSRATRCPYQQCYRDKRVKRPRMQGVAALPAWRRPRMPLSLGVFWLLGVTVASSGQEASIF